MKYTNETTNKMHLLEYNYFISDTPDICFVI